MIFVSKQIKGKGRGAKIGFPTINLRIPDDFILDEGIYSSWVAIHNKTYKGALHYGPVPTFGEKEANLEVFLIDVAGSDFPDIDENTDIEVDIVSFVRDVTTFLNVEDLTRQTEKDGKHNRLICC